MAQNPLLPASKIYGKDYRWKLKLFNHSFLSPFKRNRNHGKDG